MSWTGIGLCMGTNPNSLTWVDDHKDSFVCVGFSVDARHDMDEGEVSFLIEGRSVCEVSLLSLYLVGKETRGICYS